MARSSSSKSKSGVRLRLGISPNPPLKRRCAVTMEAVKGGSNAFALSLMQRIDEVKTQAGNYQTDQLQ